MNIITEYETITKDTFKEGDLVKINIRLRFEETDIYTIVHLINDRQIVFRKVIHKKDKQFFTYHFICDRPKRLNTFSTTQYKFSIVHDFQDIHDFYIKEIQDDIDCVEDDIAHLQEQLKQQRTLLKQYKNNLVKRKSILEKFHEEIS